MAEGFARAYGRDIIVPSSAGLAPAAFIAPLTRKVMREKNIELGDVLPKAITPELLAGCNLIVNMSGYKVPFPPGMAVEEWKVRDPIGESEQVFQQVANEIEHLVMRLILKLRAPAAKT
jgi:protein-tyrosine-phosphatase